MKVFNSYNKQKERNETILLDDVIFDLFTERNTQLKWNNFGYAMLLCYTDLQNKKLSLKPLHTFVYRYFKGVWSVQFETGVHHRDENKLNNTIDNLELVDWYSHKALHMETREYWTPPAPYAMKVA